MSLLGTLAKDLVVAGARAAVDRIGELLRPRPKPPAPAGLSHREAERIAEITRSAGRCPRCRMVHPSDRPCPPPPGAAPGSSGGVPGSSAR